MSALSGVVAVYLKDNSYNPTCLLNLDGEVRNVDASSDCRRRLTCSPVHQVCTFTYITTGVTLLIACGIAFGFLAVEYTLIKPVHDVAVGECCLARSSLPGVSLMLRPSRRPLFRFQSLPRILAVCDVSNHSDSRQSGHGRGVPRDECTKSSVRACVDIHVDVDHRSFEHVPANVPREAEEKEENPRRRARDPECSAQPKLFWEHKKFVSTLTVRRDCPGWALCISFSLLYLC